MTRAYYLGQFHLYILGVAVVVKVCVVGGGCSNFVVSSGKYELIYCICK